MPTKLLPMATSDAVACCVPLTQDVIDVDDAEQLARKFKALGDPTRVRLLSLIAAHSEREACICDLTEPVGLSQPTVSHHMKQLADAGLVSAANGPTTASSTTPSPPSLSPLRPAGVDGRPPSGLSATVRQ